MAKMAVVNMTGYHRKAQVTCNLLLPHEDNILNKIQNLERKVYSDEKTIQVSGWTKNSSYCSAPAGV